MSWKTRHTNANWVPVVLMSATDFISKLTGVTYGQVTVRYAVGGSFPATMGTWTTFSPASGDWVEKGHGVYALQLPAGAFDTTELAQGVYYVERTSGGTVSIPYYGTYSNHAPYIVNHINTYLDAAVSAVAEAVWTVASRTLTNFGTLASDIATAVWAAGTRTLTSFGALAADTATAVWAAGTRTLTSMGTLVADIWSYATRKLTSRNIGTSEDIAREQTLTGNIATGVLQNAVTVSSSAEQKIKRGDVKAFTFNLGTSWNLTNKNPYFCVKASAAAANATAIVNRICAVTDEANGVCTITLTAAETATVGTYSAEVEVRDDQDLNPQTALQFMLIIQQDVRQ